MWGFDGNLARRVLGSRYVLNRDCRVVAAPHAGVGRIHADEELGKVWEGEGVSPYASGILLPQRMVFGAQAREMSSVPTGLNPEF